MKARSEEPPYVAMHKEKAEERGPWIIVSGNVFADEFGQTYEIAPGDVIRDPRIAAIIRHYAPGAQLEEVSEGVAKAVAERDSHGRVFGT